MMQDPVLPRMQRSGLDDFARSSSSNPEEMNANVSSNRFSDEQSVRREDKGGSTCTRGLQTNVIVAGD